MEKVNYFIELNTTERFRKEPLKEMARTLLANKSFCGGGVLIVDEIKCEQVGILTGDKWNKMHDIAKRVYSGNGLAPTLHTCGGGNLEPKIMEEPIAYDEQNKYLRTDGTVGTLTTDGSSPKHNNRVIEPLLKTKMCNQLLEQGLVEEGDVIRHSYTNSRMNGEMKDIKQKDMSPTIDTRADCLGVCVKEPINCYKLFFTIFSLCDIIEEKQGDKYERSRELLSILWQEIGKKTVQREIRRLWCFQEKEVLQQRLYEKGIFEDRELQSVISHSTSNSSQYNEYATDREKVFGMWEKWKVRYTPQRWELSKQQFEQFSLFMSQLSYENTQTEISMQDMRKAYESIGLLRETLSKIQEIWQPISNKIQGYRIRKLTPREAWRLMGVKDEDFNKVEKNQSNSSLYHLAGDSIVVDVLMALFNKML